ncbi:MAG: S41 family peptidase [Verrucomicrobiales bacterium]
MRHPLAAFALCFAIFLHTASVLLAEATAKPSGLAASPDSRRDAVNHLDQAALQEIFHLLRQSYVQRDSLTLLEMNRAALEGLLGRLDFGAEIVPATQASAAQQIPPEFSLLGEMLTDRIGYLRPAAFSLAEIPAFDAALKKIVEARATTLILDLRCPAPHGEFSAAAQVTERFVRADEPLFSVQQVGNVQAQHFRSATGPLWTGRLVVLIDEESCNVAETIAAVLGLKLKLQIFGAPTRGRTMEYQEAAISPTHRLRFASAEMILPDGRSLFRAGLKPTVLAPQDIEAKHRVFRASQSEGMKKFIVSIERPRVNEHALVNRTAPELPYHLAKAAGQKSPFDEPPLQDAITQQAVDMLVARDFLEARAP